MSTAVVAICKCSQTKKLYGIRFEKTDRGWEYTWAFQINEKTASREQYDKTKISGNLIEGIEYPGCPHCGAKGFFLCSCGKINCWQGGGGYATCSWCGNSGVLSGGIESIDITGNM